MKDILFFSHNQNKITEIKQIFKSSKTKVHNLNSFKRIDLLRLNANFYTKPSRILSSFNNMYVRKYLIRCFAVSSPPE